MQTVVPSDSDDDDAPLNDFENGFIAAVLFMRGVTGHPSFEAFRDAMFVMEAYSVALTGEQSSICN